MIKIIGWAVIAFAFIACLTALRLEQAQNGKLKAQLHECAEARKADSAAKNSQKAETSERIKVVHHNLGVANDKAQVIEQAPLPGNCASPKAVLDADI